MQHAAAAALHFLRRAARKRQQQDALRIGPREHQARHTRGQRHRLASAGAGNHEQGPGRGWGFAQAMFDGLTLLRIQRGEGVGAGESRRHGSRA